MTRFSRLIESIGQQRDKVIEYQTRMTELPALGPENAGTGEMPKALYLEGLLRELGVTDILRIDAPDPRVPDGVRPNVVARIPGVSPRRLWILGHMDVVPPGELSYWKTDPWKVVVDGDKIRGRGVEDNQQAIVCGLLIAQELKAQGITPDLSLGLIFVSDEETSSRYGIHYILKTHADLFGPDDFVVVPDYGVADGSSIEISEKGQLWMRVEVLGHQCHASRPQEGRNSLVAAADMILHVRDLESIYAQVDPLFFKTICPGKFVAAVTGDVAAVSASVNKILGALVAAYDSVATVSSMMHGEYGIEDVCISTMTIIGPNGVKGKVPVELTYDEQAKLRASADALKEVIASLDI